MHYVNKSVKVSIIVPVYNSEKYISTCIDSLINQSLENIEIILVDDGSIDNSGKICDMYSETDARIISIHQENRGVSAARNKGIEQCRGEFVTFVDSDDCIAETYCEYLYKLCKENGTDIALTPQPVRVCGANYRITNDIVKDNAEVWTGIEAARNMLFYKIVISSWNKMYSANMLKRKKLCFDTELAYGEGFAFVINAFIHSNGIACGNKNIYFYRVDNENSVMTNYDTKLVHGSFEALHKIRKLIQTSSLQEAWYYAYWHTSCDCLNTMIGCGMKVEENEMYLRLVRNCRNYANTAMSAPVSAKEKMKALMYFVSPNFAARTINVLRKRKFAKAK